jgi:hypothetical protein
MTKSGTPLTVAPVAADGDHPLHPLYHRYPQQAAPQPAYLELDCQAATLAAHWDRGPMAVWHARRYPIAPATHARLLTALLATVAPFAQRVVDGWDGSSGVAQLDDDAQAAEDELRRLCEQVAEDPVQAAYDLARIADGSVWEAADWPADLDDLQVSATSTDADLLEQAAIWEAKARESSVTLWGAQEYLESIREARRQEVG